MTDRESEREGTSPVPAPDAGAHGSAVADPRRPRGPGRGLVGRAGELDALRDFLAQVDAARGGALLVSGEPGVGKSALLEAASTHAYDLGLHVVRAAGVEFEVEVSFATLNQLLGPFFGLMPQLDPADWEALGAAVQLGGTHAGDPTLVSTATLALLRKAAEHQPVLLVVDDLPWMDKASARVLAFVGRRLAQQPIGFLGAARTGEAGLFDDVDLTRLSVAALADEPAQTLLNETFPHLAGRARRRIVHDARGNPLALLELPMALASLGHAESLRAADVLPVTDRLQAVFAARVSSLPPDTCDLLLLAALDGTGDLRVLTDPGANTSRGDALDALGPAEAANLINIDPLTRRLAFRHPLTRSAVVAMATDSERRRAHTMLAARLADDPDRRAWQLAAAALGPEEGVAAELEKVAHRAAGRGDPVGAVAAYVRAADLTPQRSSKLRRLAHAAYLGANVTGDLGLAPPLLDEDAVEADPDAALTVTLAAAAQLLNQNGDLDTTYRLLVNAIEMRRGAFRADNEILVETLHTLLLICYFGGRAELWEPLDTAMARLDPAPPLDLRLLRSALGDPARRAVDVLDDLDTAIARLHQEQNAAHIRRVGIAAVFTDRVGGCLPALRRVVDDGRAGGAVTSSIDALFLLANHHYFTGAWDETEREAGEGLLLCDNLGLDMLAWPGNFLHGLVAAARGHEDTVRAMTDRMAAWGFPRRVGCIQHYIAHLNCQAALARSEYDVAFWHACLVSRPGELATHTPLAMWLILDLTEAATRSGRAEEAAAHVAAVTDAGIGRISPRLNLMVLGAAAIAAAGTAPTAEATDAFEAALAAPDARLFPFEMARIHLAYGEHLRRTRHTAAATIQLSHATEAFDRLGAIPWAKRAARELRAAGKTKPPPPPSGPRQVEPTSILTPQQRQVAELAAAGLTNKQIGERLYLSPRTVATHLYELFPKLGITSRAALRDALAAHPQASENKASAPPPD
ncbi:LuxR family transcriptional regulator [Kribbella sp. NPDC050459]|uniref:helix-turn-helix transcriptional regulator n=1 Tax=Kribbella sp. NPDC050459 TaxID=3155785 RepID=UPI0033E8615A